MDLYTSFMFMKLYFQDTFLMNEYSPLSISHGILSHKIP